MGRNNIERRVVLNPVINLQSRCNWSLQEFGSDGNQIGLDLIPLEWSIKFVVIELTLIDELIFNPTSEVNGKIEQCIITEIRSIKATLRPANNVTYSMFGTDGTVSAFDLHIRKSTDINHQWHCRVQGLMGFSDEYINLPDRIVFELIVSAEVFDRYAEKIPITDKVIFVLQSPPGFYSDWSSWVEPKFIKVLSNDEAHKVEMPEDRHNIPPRLGDVPGANLMFLRTRALGREL